MAAIQQHPIEILQTLEKRSKECAQGLPQQGQQKSLWRGIGFRVGEQLLVTPVTQVHEIMRYPSLTPVPRTHPWVKGLTNMRGRLVTVIDLPDYLGESRIASPAQSRVLVIQQDGLMLGLLVNEILGLKYFDPSERLAGHELQEQLKMSNYIRGVFKKDDCIWQLFDMKSLTSNPEFLQVAS